MNVPKPYQGKDKFIFISYSHRDTAKVFPIIFKLMENGYRVWYDQGIDPGTEWDENIATHIDTCGYFIAFMSSNYLGSSNCKDELNYARDLEKDRLIVYLEEVKLPAGMAMRVNRLQSIFKYTYVNEDDFYEKLFAANNINVCLGDKNEISAEIPEFKKEEPVNVATSTPKANNGTNTGYTSPGYNPSGAQGTYGGYTGDPNANGGYNSQNGSNNGNQGFNNGQNNGTDSYNSYSNIRFINQMALPVKNRILAAVLALLLGTLGIHKFYLGKKLQGALYLVFFWTYIPSILALIDAIILFTMTDANFMKKYKCRIG